MWFVHTCIACVAPQHLQEVEDRLAAAVQTTPTQLVAALTALDNDLIQAHATVEKKQQAVKIARSKLDMVTQVRACARACVCAWYVGRGGATVQEVSLLLHEECGFRADECGTGYLVGWLVGWCVFLAHSNALMYCRCMWGMTD